MGFVANNSTVSVLVQKCVVNQLKLVEAGFVVIDCNSDFVTLFGQNGFCGKQFSIIRFGPKVCSK